MTMTSTHNYNVPKESPPKYSKYSSPTKNAPPIPNSRETSFPAHEMTSFIGRPDEMTDGKMRKHSFMPLEHEKSAYDDYFSSKSDAEDRNVIPCPNCNRRRLLARQRRCKRVMVWTQFAMIVAIFIFVVVLICVTIYAAIMIQDAINQADYAIRNNAVTNVAGRVKALFNRIRPKSRSDGKVVEVDVT